MAQIQRDDQIHAIVKAMHDAFDFVQEAEILKNFIPASTQVKVLELMLLHVRNCGDFIQAYAKDTQFCMSSSHSVSPVINMSSAGKRVLKNICGEADKPIEDLCTAFVKLRQAFLDYAAVTTEITALQILDNVGVISARLNVMTTQLEWVASKVTDLGM